jgi:hypothetical protein
LLALCALWLGVELLAGQLGVYHWAARTPRGADHISAALPDIRRLGFQTLRIFVGGRYDYLHPLRSPERFAGVARPLTLARILALPRYRQLFDHPQLTTVWLTAYPVFDYGPGPDEIDLRRPVSEAEWRQQYGQLYEATVWLYRNFGSREKIVLISNHEADEKLLEVLNAGAGPELALKNLARDLETRFRAISEARRAFPSARLKVFCGAEISLWKLKLAPAGGQPQAGMAISRRWVKAGQGWNALEAVLPRARFDFVSFSAWETVAQPDVAAALREALEDIGRRTRAQLSPAGRRFFGERHVAVGEFGYAREWKLGPKAEAGVAAFAAAAAAGVVPYAVYWQLYDNMEGEVKEFGLIDPAGNLTPAGAAIRARKRPSSGRAGPRFRFFSAFSAPLR